MVENSVCLEIYQQLILQMSCERNFAYEVTDFEVLSMQRKNAMLWGCAERLLVCKQKRKVFPKTQYPDICHHTGVYSVTWLLNKPLHFPHPPRIQIHTALSEIPATEKTVHSQSDIFIPLHLHWTGWMTKMTAVIKPNFRSDNLWQSWEKVA